MKVLAVGDVCAPDGSAYALKMIPLIKREENIDLVILNGENSAAGNGITPDSADMLFAAGADVITGGNHTLRRKEFYDTLDSNPFVLRPHNLKDTDVGSGYCLLDMGKFLVAVINISEQLKSDILAGKMKQGEYLPSIRGLAKELKISVITTMKAYELLEAEGLVTAAQGKGFYVNAQDSEMLREQHLRRVEDALQEAITAAKIAGMSEEELQEMLRALMHVVD